MKLIHSTALSAALLVSLVFGHFASAATYYVDPVNGLDTNPGTLALPKKTIAGAGAIPLAAGDIVNLRGTGHYPYSDFTTAAWSGTLNNVITVQSYTGETAVFDPGYAEFKTTNTTWVVCTETGAVTNEYISVNTYSTDSNGGTFLGSGGPGGSGDRLMRYHRIEDLRATNESFVKVPVSDPRPGLPIYTDQNNKYPWTYRGPGLWWDSVTQKIHFRATATHYNQAGVTDYSGGTDPRNMSLSISGYSVKAVSVGASYITFKNIVFQNGGGGVETVAVSPNNANVTFDHCTINAGRYALRFSGNTFLTLTHCVVDSHLPSYTCRSDVKDQWDVLENGQRVTVNGTSSTSQMQLVDNTAVISYDLEIDHCEFRNCHDSLQLFDIRSKVHDSLFENINDEVFSFESGTLADDVRVYNNVIRKALQTYSFAGGTTSTTNPRYLYRNILDNRIPILSSRVMSPDVPPVGTTAFWRTGSDFKMNTPIGPFYFYQNTTIQRIPDAAENCTALGNCSLANLQERRFMNNIHMTISTDKSIHQIPDPGFPALSDGNIWCRRINTPASPMYKSVGTPSTYVDYPTLAASALWTSFFNANGVGWDPSSQFVYPQFTDVGDYGYSNGVAYLNADYRLKSASPALGVGVDLTATGWPDTVAADTTPDIGALPFGAATVAVGVDSRYVFPNSTTPIAEAGDYSVISDADTNGFHMVSFDGTGSSDPDGSITGYNWVYNGASISTNSTFSKDLPIGMHQVLLTVTDNSSNTATDMREVTVSDPTTYDNVALNPGFENGLTNWTVGGAGGTTSVSTPTHFGGGAARQPGAAAYQLLYQNVPVVAGASTKASGWIKTDSVPSASPAAYQVTWLDSSLATISTFNVVVNLSGTTNWTYFGATSTAPTNAAYGQIRLTLNGGTGTYNAYYDDMRLMALDNKVKNGFFERGLTSWLAASTAKITTDPTLVHDGTQAHEFVSAAASLQTKQDVPVTAATTYTILGWLKTTATSWPAGKFARIQYEWYDSAGVKIGSTQTLAAVSAVQNYTLYTTSKVAPTGAVTLRMILHLDGNTTTGKAYFDGIYVR